MPDDLILTRRSFLGGAAASSVVGAVSGPHAFAAPKASTYFELFRQPDSVTAYAGLEARIALVRSGGRWQAEGVEAAPEMAKVEIRVSAPAAALTHVHVRWNLVINTGLRFLGDHWERSYGD